MVHGACSWDRGNGVNPLKSPFQPSLLWSLARLLGAGSRPCPGDTSRHSSRCREGAGDSGPRKAARKETPGSYRAPRGRTPREPGPPGSCGGTPARRLSQWGRRWLRHSGWAGRRGGIPRAATSQWGWVPLPGRARAGGGSQAERSGAAGPFPARRRAGCAARGFAGAAFDSPPPLPTAAAAPRDVTLLRPGAAVGLPDGAGPAGGVRRWKLAGSAAAPAPPQPSFSRPSRGKPPRQLGRLGFSPPRRDSSPPPAGRLPAFLPAVPSLPSCHVPPPGPGCRGGGGPGEKPAWAASRSRLPRWAQRSGCLTCCSILCYF